MLSGILFVLPTGIQWEFLPQELGSGMTCWRRLEEWNRAGVWQQLHERYRPRASAHGSPAAAHYTALDWASAGG